jgi:hypothetical protein
VWYKIFNILWLDHAYLNITSYNKRVVYKSYLFITETTTPGRFSLCLATNWTCTACFRYWWNSVSDLPIDLTSWSIGPQILRCFRSRYILFFWHCNWTFLLVLLWRTVRCYLYCRLYNISELQWWPLQIWTFTLRRWILPLHIWRNFWWNRTLIYS